MKNPLDSIRTDGGYVGIFRTIGFIGDSLSSGEFESMKDGEKGYHDMYEYSWGQYIARKSGLKAYNFSQGGLRCKSFFEYIKKNNPFEEERRCQCYVIALGVNDMSHLDDTYTKGFGSMADVDMDNPGNNADSYVGWYCKIIQKLRVFAPKCRIFVLTTPTESPETEEKKAKFDAVQSFLNELPKYFDYLYCMDIRKYGPIYDEAWRKKYFLGGHMNPMGYMFTADMVSTYMSYYIETRPEDFAQVGFLYTGFHNESVKW